MAATILPALPRDRAELVDAAVNHWLAGLRPATNHAYADAFVRAAKYFPPDPLRIDVMEARRILGELQRDYRPTTVDQTRGALSSLWEHLRRLGMVQENPWRAVPLRQPKATWVERILSEQELARLVAAAPTRRDRSFLRFLAATGARVAEAVAVRWRDIRIDGEDEHGVRVLVTLYGKGGKTRIVRLPASVYGALLMDADGNTAPTQAPEHFLFPFSERRARQIVRRAAERAGLAPDRPVSPHWLRHSFATGALRHGAPVQLVQRDLGHAKLETTARYLHALPEEAASDYLPPI